MFSVLIANYNNGRYLQEAIDSVLAQTYTDWEIIIVDDGSTDNSSLIYDKYRDKNKIHIYHNECNKGCTYTKWRLIEECNGDLFGFLDADDTLMLTALEEMVKAHNTNPDAAIVSSRHYLCDERLNVMFESRLLRIPTGESYLTLGDFKPEAFVSFKTSFYKKTKGLNKENAFGDDQELLMIMEEVGDWVVLDKFLYNYRISDKSVSHGEDNYICLYWNMIVYHEACVRRGLDPNKYSYNVFHDFIQYQKNRIMGSKTYRIGNTIQHPWRFVKWHTKWVNKILYKSKENIQRLRYSFLPYCYKAELFNDTFLANNSLLNDTISLSKPVDKVIYCFWTGNNEMSENRKRCFDSICKNAGVPVKLITPDNLHEYILSDHPLHPAFQYLSMNHKSDYLRGYFMHYYGGGFCDIKMVEHSWESAFDRLNNSNKYILGYQELNGNCSAHKDIDNQNLKKEVKRAWPLLIGNCAFICRPRTKFTEEWHAEQNRRLDYYYKQLIEHPATDIFGQGNEYPIPWLYMQGEIFHPLCLKYHRMILQDDTIRPLFTNYR